MKCSTYQYTVSLNDIDFSKRIKIPNLFLSLLDAANRNATENEFSVEQLLEHNCTWVLLRIALEMKHFPTNNESYSVETWVEGFNRLATTRSFAIYNSNGEVIGNATSNWAMIDMNTRRPMNLQNTDFCSQKLAEYTVERKSPCGSPNKLWPMAAATAITERTVCYSDIDINHHANSGKYIEWLLDAIPNPMEFFAHEHITRIELHYVNEALLGDKLMVSSEAIDEHEAVYDVKRNSDTICQMRIRY